MLGDMAKQIWVCMQILWIPARAAELLTIEPSKHCEKRGKAVCRPIF